MIGIFLEVMDVLFSERFNQHTDASVRKGKSMRYDGQLEQLSVRMWTTSWAREGKHTFEKTDELFLEIDHAAPGHSSLILYLEDGLLASQSLGSEKSLTSRYKNFRRLSALYLLSPRLYSISTLAIVPPVRYYRVIKADSKVRTRSLNRYPIK